MRVGEVPAGFVDQDVPARHQEQPLAALEEKTAGVRQRLLLIESEDACGGKKYGFDHRGPRDYPACAWADRANASMKIARAAMTVSIAPTSSSSQKGA